MRKFSLVFRPDSASSMVDFLQACPSCLLPPVPSLHANSLPPYLAAFSAPSFHPQRLAFALPTAHLVTLSLCLLSLCFPPHVPSTSHASIKSTVVPLSPPRSDLLFPGKN